MGWDFERSDLGPLIGGVGGPKRSSHCLATFFVCLGARVSPGARPKPSEREPWERSSSHCPVLALVSLLPGSFLPATPVPPCLPRLLHRSRFPTAHHLAFRQLREFAQSMLEERWNHRSLGRAALALFQAQMRRQSAPKKPSQPVFSQQGHLNLSSTPVTSGRAFPEAARSLEGDGLLPIRRPVLPLALPRPGPC